MMTIRASMDKVLVNPDDIEEEVNGIYVPKTKYDHPTTGTVIDIGKPLHYPNAPEGLNVGDRVYFKDMAGSEFEYEGEKYFALLFEEILGYESA